MSQTNENEPGNPTSHGKSQSRRRALAKLRDWPFIPPTLLDTPDPHLIESLGLAALNRALNLRSRRVVAFLGAGVSMSYGRIGWQDLNYSMQLEVMTRYELLNKPKGHGQNGGPLQDHSKEAGIEGDGKVGAIEGDNNASHIVTLYKTLKRLKVSRRQQIPQDRLPTIFQICDRLDEALTEWEKRQATKSVGSLPGGNDERSEFRERVIGMTMGDFGHAEQIILDAMRDVGAVADKDIPNSRAQRECFEGDDRVHKFRGLFTCTSASVLFKELQAHSDAELRSLAGPQRDCTAWDMVDPLMREIQSHLATQAGRDGHRYLLPTHRFLVGVLLRLLPRDQRREVMEARGTPNGKAFWNQEPPAPMRHDIVPRSRDPLAILHQDFEISRFLTTNYDDEIERMLRDQGFSVVATNDGSKERPHDRIDPLQPTAREIVFFNTSVGELVAFAVQEGSSSAGVVHLHGKAEKNGEIVATEADYQKRYMRQDEMRPLIDEAIGLAFAANPILFVGSGMGEDDILRPLRHFMSAPARQGSRLAIALLPALDAWPNIDQQQLMLLQRYGIHAVYYGWARVPAGEAADLQNTRPGADATKRLPRDPVEQTHVMWLPEVWSIKRTIEQLLNAVDDPGKFFELFTLQEKMDSYCQKLRAASHEVDSKLAKLLAVPCGRDNEEGDNGKEEKISLVRKDVSNRRFEPHEANRTGSTLLLISPSQIEGIELGDDATRTPMETGSTSEIGLNLEVGIINAAISFVRRLEYVLSSQNSPWRAVEKPEDNPYWRAVRRAIKAHHAALAGAGDGIISAFLCARLRRARRECEAWHDAWFKIPRPRDSGPRASTVSAAPEMVYVERHALQLGSMSAPPTSQGKPPLVGDKHRWTRPRPRFYADAPSKAFHAWLSGLAQHKTAIRAVVRRRAFLVAARRGVGKGHFFACLQNQERNSNLSQLLEVIGAEGQQWFGVAFFNLSFSHEVGSVLDRIAWFLYEFLKALTARHPELNQRYARDWKQVEQDRLGQLDFVLRELDVAAVHWRTSEGDGPPPRRVFIALNCASMMFDADGRAKNDQVRRWFEILLDARKSGALPIDLLFVCTEDAIPHYFCEGAPEHCAIELLSATRGDISEKGRRATEQRSDRLKLQLRNEHAVQTIATRPRLEFGVVHFLHTARVSLLAVAFFPEIALVTARAILGIGRRDESTAATLQPYCNIYEERSLDQDRCNVIELFRRLWDELAPLSQELAESEPLRAPLSVDLLPSLLMLAAGRGLQAGDTSAMLGERFAKVKDAVIRALTEECSKTSHCQINLDEQLARAVFAGGDEAESLIAEARLIDADMRETYEVLGRGRFTLTLLFATMSELIRPASLRGAGSSPGGGGTFISAHHFEEAATVGWKFFNEVRRDAKSVAEPQRADFVIGKVLNRIKEQHTTNKPLPIDPPSGALVCRTGKELFELQDALLWHLTVIGQPVEADVLARCTLVRRAADVVMSNPEASRVDGSRDMVAHEELVEWTLDLMVHRCLVHRLKPVLVSMEDPRVRARDRFALHRLMQRHILQRLGTPFVEYPEADDLAPTLYASQPKNLPRLSVSDHAELRETVVALSGYPDASGRGQLFRRDTTDAEKLFGLENERKLSVADDRLCRDLRLDLQKRMLRAALGIVRSVYSVPALIRFDVTSESVWRGYGRDDARLQSSLLEEHRQQVRWLLSQAVDVGRERRRKGDKDKDNKDNDSTQWTHSPFYREEIVALFNEYDLLGLIQGQVSDASEPFERSTKAARYLEPDESGPLHTRVLLNAVVCDIERGRLISARTTLKRIIAAEERPEPCQRQSLSFLIATGYLGLVAHLSGDSPHAHELYKSAFDGLRQAHQSRAASIFARHRADLLRSEHSEESHRHAAALVEIALSLARDCGHEDIRHMALLSQAKLTLLREDMRDYAEIHLNLNAIDRYGRVIGMRRLECEVAQVRATLHLRSGDLITAASLATRSLEIATQCELIVRKIKLLRLLASINVKQGQFAIAVPMLEEAMSMARACGWNLGLERAQNLMNEAMGARMRA